MNNQLKGWKILYHLRESNKFIHKTQKDLVSVSMVHMRGIKQFIIIW